MPELREPGFYRDTANGDLWRLRSVTEPGAASPRQAWEWINGNRWTRVPKTLERLEPQP